MKVRIVDSAAVQAGTDGLAFSGTAQAGQEIVVSYFDGSAVQYYGIVTADADGSWTLPVSSELVSQNAQLTFESAGGEAVTVDVAASIAAQEIVDAPVSEEMASVVSGQIAEVAVAVPADGEAAGSVETGAADASASEPAVTTELVTTTKLVSAVADNNRGDNGKAAAPAFSVHVDGDANGDNALNASELDAAGQSLSFTGTGEPGETVYVSYFKDGSVQSLGHATVDADGNWTFEYDKSGLEDQNIQFVFEQGDRTIDVDVVIDTVAPVISDTSLSTDTGVSNTDRLTNDATPTFAGHLDEQATVEVLIDGKVVGSGLSDASGAWAVDTSTLADGEHTVQFVATDIYGNKGAIHDAASVTIDTVNNDTISLDSVNRALVARTTGRVSGGETVQVRLVVDGRTDEAVTVDVNEDGTWSGNVNTHVRQGHTLEVTGVDAAGNATEVATRTFDNSDPLAIDMNGNGRIDTISMDEGTRFDLDNDGFLNQVSWLAKGDGLLVLDKNDNGAIDNGSELFGPTGRHADGSLVNDGYAELSAYDLNGDKVIDQNDSIFDDLQVWVDGNMNAVTDAGELVGVADLGIVSISLDRAGLDYTDAAGVYHKDASRIQFEDGRTRVMEDVLFEDIDDAIGSDNASAGAGETMYDVYVADNSTVLPAEDPAMAIVV
ncbi:Ig-like domain-containing protein [Pelagibacterium halotolerans]|uniref:Ig-like domain-containing protein n=1 Tax=Pelagibacterium halotolerans TaxID=531813 RepID=UPI00384F01E5